MQHPHEYQKFPIWNKSVILISNVLNVSNVLNGKI